MEKNIVLLTQTKETGVLHIAKMFFRNMPQKDKKFLNNFKFYFVRMHKINMIQNQSLVYIKWLLRNDLFEGRPIVHLEWMQYSRLSSLQS